MNGLNDEREGLSNFIADTRQEFADCINDDLGSLTASADEVRDSIGSKSNDLNAFLNQQLKWLQYFLLQVG